MFRVSDGWEKPECDFHKHHKPHKKIDVIKDIDAVPSNVQSARQAALLYVFEDNEAVIKMIINGRSPTMRHVSRTHRVALDWLLDRINLDSKIQIFYIDTKNQLADILTEGNLTRDEWNHFFNLLNISHFCSTACNVKTSSTRIRTRNVSQPNRDPWWNNSEDAFGRVVLTSSNPGRTSYRYQDPGKSVAGDDRSGKPEKTSGNIMQQVVPHREEPLLDGNAHSLRYGGMTRDGSGKLDKVDSQEGAHSETYVMGSDAAEFQ